MRAAGGDGGRGQLVAGFRPFVQCVRGPRSLRVGGLVSDLVASRAISRIASTGNRHPGPVGGMWGWHGGRLLGLGEGVVGQQPAQQSPRQR